MNPVLLLTMLHGCEHAPQYLFRLASRDGKEYAHCTRCGALGLFEGHRPGSWLRTEMAQQAEDICTDLRASQVAAATAAARRR
jgi:hypothetical protein